MPSRQPVNQVVEQADERYGLAVNGFTGSIPGYAAGAKAEYQNADKVAITTDSSLFNTRPFFANPDVIITDDAHAAENYISSMWTLRVERFNEEHTALYAAVASVLKPLLDPSNYSRLTGEWNSVSDRVW